MLNIIHCIKQWCKGEKTNNLVGYCFCTYVTKGRQSICMWQHSSVVVCLFRYLSSSLTWLYPVQQAVARQDYLKIPRLLKIACIYKIFAMRLLLFNTYIHVFRSNVGLAHAGPPQKTNASVRPSHEDMCVASFTEHMTLTAAPMRRITPYHRGFLQLLALVVNQTCIQK